MKAHQSIAIQRTTLCRSLSNDQSWLLVARELFECMEFRALAILILLLNMYYRYNNNHYHIYFYIIA